MKIQRENGVQRGSLEYSRGPWESAKERQDGTSSKIVWQKTERRGTGSGQSKMQTSYKAVVCVSRCVPRSVDDVSEELGEG